MYCLTLGDLILLRIDYVAPPLANYCLADYNMEGTASAPATSHQQANEFTSPADKQASHQNCLEKAHTRRPVNCSSVMFCIFVCG